jgi:N-formylmaleamate deformylase
VRAALEPDYDLILLDARWHGLSDAPAAGGHDEMPNDVAGVIEALGLKKPGLIGHSMGAMAAARTAARFPHLVGFVVLEDPAWRYPEETPEQRSAFLQQGRQRTIDRRSMTTEQMIAYSLRDNPGLALWDKSEFAGWSDAKRHVSEWLHESLGDDMFRYTDIVPKIVCPALLLRSDPAKGGIVNDESARIVHELNPRIEIVQIAGAGHNIRREQFDQYIAAVTEFLSRVARRTD